LKVDTTRLKNSYSGRRWRGSADRFRDGYRKPAETEEPQPDGRWRRRYLFGVREEAGGSGLSLPGTGEGDLLPGAHPRGVSPGSSLSGTGGDWELLAGGATVLAGAFFYPYVEGWVRHLTPGCLFRRVTGLPCLLCGMTRSLAAAAHGDFAESFRLHLLGPPLFVLLVAVTLSLAVETVLGRRLLPRPGREAGKVLFRAVMAALVAAWVLRLLVFGSEV